MKWLIEVKTSPYGDYWEKSINDPHYGIIKADTAEEAAEIYFEHLGSLDEVKITPHKKQGGIFKKIPSRGYKIKKVESI